MHRVYLLLRNNQESGPFTIDELRQQDLSSSDLIWVEGRSSAWAYPYELEELTFPLNAETAVSSDKSRKDPASEIEERAEEIRKRALTYTPQAFYPHPFHDTEEKYRSIVLPGEEDIDVVYHRRRGTNLSQYAAAAMLTILLGLGWYQRGLLFNARSGEAQPEVKARIVTSESNLAKQPEKASDQPVQVMRAATIDSMALAAETAAQPLKKVRAVPAVARLEDSQLASLTEPPVINTAITQEETKKSEPELPPVTAPVKPVANPEATPTNVNEEGENASERKRGLGRALKSIFKKKKKDDEKSPEDATPADNG